MSEVFFASGSDPAIEAAYRSARETFRYFWRELSWERRRIVPAFDLSVVKFQFRDEGSEEVEQMWVSEVDFDGHLIRGTLLNAPNQLKSISEGDPVERPLSELSDWMLTSQGTAYGAFTVAVMRSQMKKAERKQHDDAWGLDFGDPKSPRLPSMDAEHPMAVNMLGSLEEHLRKNPSATKDADAEGWTLLHQDSLAGNKACVEMLLRFGADPLRKTKRGATPAELAKALGWTELAKLLQR